MIRLIKNKVWEHREHGEQIARALITPVNGIPPGVPGEREKLRFLQHARNVATNTLFKRSKVEVGIDNSDNVVEDCHDRSSSISSLLRSRDPSDSMQSVMIVVNPNL